MTEEQMIDNFADAMKKKLRLRKNRYVPMAWKTMDHKRLLMLLMEELTELEESCHKGNSEEITDEAADVANYAMFIAELAKL